jgi:hypothetical protein
MTLDSILDDGDKPKTRFSGLTDAQLYAEFKAGRLPEADLRTELKDRGKTAEAINILVTQNTPKEGPGIKPPSLPGAGLDDPSAGVRPSSPYDKLSENELQQYVYAGIITPQELEALKGPANAAAIMAPALTTADKQAVANLKANPPNIPEWNTGQTTAQWQAQGSPAPAGGAPANAPAAAPTGVAGIVWNEAYDYAVKQGSPPEEAAAYARVAVAIAHGESGMNPAAVRDTRSGDDPLVSSGKAQREHSVGLFQLNFMGGRGTSSGLTAEQATDPLLNTRASMADLYGTFKKQGGLEGFNANPNGFTQVVYQKGQGSITPDMNRQIIPGLALTSGGAPTNTAGSRFPAVNAQGGGTAGSGGTAAAAPPAPPPITPNSLEDLKGRNAQFSGSNIVLGGQSYMKGQEVKQGNDGYWYTVSPDGKPVARFASQAEANKNVAYSPVGVAVQARNPENSPLARAAARGGNVPKVDNSNFNLNSMDQMIASGGLKGEQTGDIITTVRPGGTKGSPLEVSAGGIPEYGGLTPVRNAAGDNLSYTGQLPGNVSIGFSSAVTGNRPQDLYWLQQQGIESKYAEKMNDDQLRRLNEVIGNRRAAGTMPDLAQQLSRTKVFPQSVSKAEYEAQVNSILQEAGLQENTYFPEYQDPLDPYANRQGPYDYDGSLLTFAQGGSMVANGPTGIVDLQTNQLKGLIGEAGEQEMISGMGTGRVDITPMGRPQTGGLMPPRMGIPRGEMPSLPPQANPMAGMMQQMRRAMGPYMAQERMGNRKGGIRGFADGGTVYSGYGGAGGTWGSVTQNPYSGVEGENPMTHPDLDYIDGYPGGRGGVSGVTVPAMFKQGMTTPQGNYIPGADDMGGVGMQKWSPNVGMAGVRHRNAVSDFRNGTGGVLPAGGPVGYRMEGTGQSIPVYSTNPDLHARLDAQGDANYRYVPTTINGRPAYLKQYVGGPSGINHEVSRGAVSDIFKGALGGLFGWGEDDGGQRIDPLREATDKRDYDIQAANYRRAGMAPPAILDLLDTDDEGNRFYRNFTGQIPNGMRLPFGYDPANTGSGNWNRTKWGEWADRGRRMSGGLMPPLGG